MLDFVILDIYLALAIGIVSDHEITQYMHCVMLLCFLKKLLCLACFVVSKYAVYIYMNTEIPMTEASSSVLIFTRLQKTI